MTEITSYAQALDVWKRANPHWDDPPRVVIPAAAGLEDNTDYLIQFDEGPDFMLICGPGPEFVRKADGHIWNPGSGYPGSREGIAKLDAMRPTS